MNFTPPTMITLVGRQLPRRTSHASLFIPSQRAPSRRKISKLVTVVDLVCVGGIYHGILLMLVGIVSIVCSLKYIELLYAKHTLASILAYVGIVDSQLLIVSLNAQLEMSVGFRGHCGGHIGHERVQ